MVDFPLPAGQGITITGETFQPGAGVRLGQAVGEGVEWVDENTPRFTLPDGIQYGSYDVWVTNPGGQTAARLGGLRLGQALFLPEVINR